MADKERTQTLTVLGNPDTPPQTNSIIQEWMTVYRESTAELQKKIGMETFTDGKIVYLPLGKQATSIFYEENTDDKDHPPRHIKGADESGSHALVFEQTASAKFAPGFKKPLSEYVAYDAVTASITPVTPGEVVVKNSTFESGLGAVPTIGIIGQTTMREGSVDKTTGVLLWVNPSFKATGFKTE